LATLVAQWQSKADGGPAHESLEAHSDQQWGDRLPLVALQHSIASHQPPPKAEFKRGDR
jgi:hypothetical protein